MCLCLSLRVIYACVYVYWCVYLLSTRNHFTMSVHNLNKAINPNVIYGLTMTSYKQLGVIFCGAAKDTLWFLPLGVSKTAIRSLANKSREFSKPRDLCLERSDRREIWKVSVTLLPRRLSNSTAIPPCWHPLSQFRDFVRYHHNSIRQLIA